MTARLTNRLRWLWIKRRKRDTIRARYLKALRARQLREGFATIGNAVVNAAETIGKALKVVVESIIQPAPKHNYTLAN